MMNRPVQNFSQGWDSWIQTATLWIIFLDWFNTHAKLAQPYEKEILTPSFSILLPGASCVKLAQVSVWLPSAQDVEIDPAGKKTPCFFW